MTLLKRLLIVVHRWLGVALSLVFAIWFASGIVMMYRGFPAVGARERLQHSPALAPSRITVSPGEAFASLGPDEPLVAVRLTSVDRRPAYRLDLPSGTRVVYADDGTAQAAVDGAMIDRAAAAWAGRYVGDARKQSVEDVDQWTVDGELRARHPLYKYSWPDGQQVYVDGNTAEVVQYTTTASRFWAYLGAIPHWLYFTPLRRHQAAWSSFVVYTSLLGTIAASIGVVLIAWMYSPLQRYRHAGARTSIPYRGWKRWHAIAGLLFGVVTTTWTFSGLLSMGPFPIVDRLAALAVRSDSAGEQGNNWSDSMHARLASGLRGGESLDLASFADTTPADAVAALDDFGVKELELASFAGEPFYLARDGGGDSRIIPIGGEPRAAFRADDVMAVIREAAGSDLAELRVMEEYDAHYLDRRNQRPLPVVLARMNDAAGTRYYIDLRTARIAGAHSARNWADRWLYHGLHSLDFPWLYKNRPCGISS